MIAAVNGAELFLGAFFVLAGVAAVPLVVLLVTIVATAVGGDR